MRFVRPPFFYQWFSPHRLLCGIPGPEKVLYLTFDDGPVPDATPAVLEILDRYGVPATFFMVGDNVRKHPEVYAEVIRRGHAAGNHTFHHLHGWRTPPGAYAEDVFRCRERVPSALFRPPYGKFTPAQYFLLRRDFRFILWSVLTYDFDASLPQEKCLAMAVENTRPGGIIVFHDHPKAARNALFVLPRYIEHFLSRGYRFEVIPQEPPVSPA